MKTLSLDIRTRILECYDKGEGTRAEIARRFCVSLAMVKKLLCQRKKTGDIAPRHYLSGPKPGLIASHQIIFIDLLSRRPDMTLAELREQAGLNCTLPALFYVLKKMGLTYKKRLSGQANKTVPT